MVRKLFLTPPELPGEVQCRSIEIPSSQEWLGIFNQALLQLTKPYNFEQVNDTDLTPDEVAAYCYGAYVAWLESTCGGSTDIPTPFWDAVTQTDDQYPADEQPWYGYVTDPDAPADELTFVEQASIWALTGLLAVSGTPAAAILFQTVAPSFALAMRGGDVAEIIRILVDAHDQATVETTGNPDEEFVVSLIGDPDLSVHDILIILQGVV